MSIPEFLNCLACPELSWKCIIWRFQTASWSCREYLFIAIPPMSPNAPFAENEQRRGWNNDAAAGTKMCFPLRWSRYSGWVWALLTLPSPIYFYTEPCWLDMLSNNLKLTSGRFCIDPTANINHPARGEWKPRAHNPALWGVIIIISLIDVVLCVASEPLMWLLSSQRPQSARKSHKLILSILPGKLDASVAELFVSTGSRLWALRLQNNGNDSLWKKKKMKRKKKTTVRWNICFVACYEQIAWKKYINMSQWVISLCLLPP